MLHKIDEIPGKGKPQSKAVSVPLYNERPATETEVENQFIPEIHESFTDSEVESFISKNVLGSIGWWNKERKNDAYAKIRAVGNKYNFYPLTSFTFIKNRVARKYISTAQYPMILIDAGENYKIVYEPKNPDAKRRYNLFGNKPKDYIHGLSQLESEFAKKKADIEAGKNADKEDKDRGADTDKSADTKKEEDPRFKDVIICFRASDAFNLALLDYRVIWTRDVTKLPYGLFDKLLIKVKKVYQLPAICPVAKRAAHQLAMENLDLFNIELPEDLRNRQDQWENACKDVRDYFDYYRRKDFYTLVNNALPYRFWEKKEKYEGRGDNKFFVGYDYDFDNLQAYNFLEKNGFARLRSGDKKTDWIYIRKKGNTVMEQDPNDIKDFVHNFLKERMYDKNLRNSMFRTNQLGEGSLSNLPLVDIDFSAHDKETQFMFFQNKTIKVTASGIEEFKPGEIDRYIWDEELLRHNFELHKTPPFVITKDELGTYDIEINNEDCYFLRYLIQTSRIHWRSELEGERFEKLSAEEQEAYKVKYFCSIEGANLTREEIDEQKRHLVNKIFAIGYLLHRYKDRSKPWFVYAMDNKFNDDGQSHGGSGKSILFDMAMRAIHRKSFQLPGRNPKLADDPHKYDGLTEHCPYVLIDDAHEYLRLDVFYTDVTGDIKVNPKGKRPYIIPFEKSGKFAVTTNYTAKNLGPSTERRMLYTAFSDYYHNAGETTDYKESRDPKSDFGISLFTEFTPEAWNDFYNTMAYCLRFYLSVSEKIGPAMDGVTKRNLFSAMGNNFHDWAFAYFSEESERLDCFIVREEIFMDFKMATDNHKETPQKFLEKMRAFCKYYGYVLNPKALLGKRKNMIKKVPARTYDKINKRWVDIPGVKKEPKEVFYIQTKNEIPDEVNIPMANDEEDGLPI